MGLNRALHYPIGVLIALLFSISCNPKKSKSDIEVTFVQDTLAVDYTYWWSESGPFIGYCGEEYALVFTGTITDIQNPSEAPGPLYTSQNGIIRIENIFKIQELAKKQYNSQQFFVSDCFNDLHLNIGDNVLVFCYNYEGAVCIPGGKSILKINGFDDPIVKSIKRYIDADQNSLKIKSDIKFWKKYGLDDELEKILRCHESES